jgi:hypothetical protein
MRLILRSAGGLVEILFLAGLVAGCSPEGNPAGNTPPGGSGGLVQGGAPGTGGGAGAGGRGGAPGTGAGGGTAGAPDAGAGGTPGTGGSTTSDASTGPAPDASTGPTPDASTGLTPDASTAVVDSNTPMNVDGAPLPSYEGEIPIHYGPEVGPIVEMQCPGDPTQGWTEYRDSFHLEHPYRVPANTRFSITGGIYNFWVFPNDSPHSPIAMGRNPRTEATYGGLRDKQNVGTVGGVSAKIGYFTTGMRMYSADMLLEPSSSGSAIMQIHTTATGGGPIGLRLSGGNLVNNGSLTVVTGSTVPGGLVNRWFNFKASLNTANRQVQIWINNCLKSTYTGPRGDGRFYFKNGVYFCDDGGGCRTHFKNVHFYEK